MVAAALRSANQGKKKQDISHDHRENAQIIQIFRFTLPDPDDRLDVESVRSLYAATYPEITTAALTGPEAVDGKLVYTFTKAIGTKG